MCSVVILRRPGHAWPLVLGANRDEMAGRPWKPPGRHWPDRPDVIAGLDETAGGSWFGMNDQGVVAAVLNGFQTLGPAPGKRSRGELPLEALDHADASAAAEALASLDPAAYRPFHLLVADDRDAFLLSNPGGAARRLSVATVPTGVSMVTSAGLNAEAASACQRLYLPLFRAAPPPDPDGSGPNGGDWTRWRDLLASRIWDGDAGPHGAMCVVTEVGFGTVCSTLLALPSVDRQGVPPVWLFAPGRPDLTDYAPVAV